MRCATSKMINALRDLFMLQREIVQCVKQSEASSRRLRDITTEHSDKTRIENRKREESREESGD